MASIAGKVGTKVSSAQSLQPYSCLVCRKQKRKCDRLNPCTNCRKTDSECLFVPRKISARQPVSAVLLKKVRELEGVIRSLQRQLDSVKSRHRSQSFTESSENSQMTPGVVDLRVKLGSLAIENGRSRYITSNAWASLDNQIEDLSGLLAQRCDYQRERDIPSSRHASILGFGAADCNLAGMHPPADQILKYWNIFMSNCDVLVKVLHIPTAEALILEAAQQLNRVSLGLEALMMAIYFSAVMSISPEECIQVLGNDKEVLLARFKFGAEQAFSRAGLLDTDEIMTLQAFTIFLTGLHVCTNLRVMSTLTTLLVRLAKNAGIHRDGTHFNLSPFAVEMRRRLWWSICVLDSRACEDTGYESTIALDSVDTRLPLSVEDIDLTPNMTELPPAQIGQTRMTFSVVRAGSIRAFQRVQYGSASADPHFSAVEKLEQKTKLITDAQSRIQEQYLKHLDTSDPLSWYTSSICQIVFSKMWLVAYHPFLWMNGSIGLPQSVRDWLFSESTSAIETWLRLNNEDNCRQWKWLCETYIQWYAFAFLLSELCQRTKSETVDRAWNAIDSGLRLGLKIHSSSCELASMDIENGADISGMSCDLYKPLRRIWERARAKRNDFHGTIQAEDA